MAATFEVLTVIIAIGFVLGTIWICRFCSRLEQNVRDTITLVIRSNNAVLARADRIAEATQDATQFDSETGNVVRLDRRIRERRREDPQSGLALGGIERRALPGRRLKDTLSTL